MKYPNKHGAASTRINNYVQQVMTGHVQHKAGSSVYKQEDTNSEFWNLTADDESQMDPVQVMAKLTCISTYDVLSGNTSIIQVQEADNKTTPTTQRNSLISTVN